MLSSVIVVLVLAVVSLLLMLLRWMRWWLGQCGCWSMPANQPAVQKGYRVVHSIVLFTSLTTTTSADDGYGLELENGTWINVALQMVTDDNVRPSVRPFAERQNSEATVTWSYSVRCTCNTTNTILFHFLLKSLNTTTTWAVVAAPLEQLPTYITQRHRTGFQSWSLTFQTFLHRRRFSCYS